MHEYAKAAREGAAKKVKSYSKTDPMSKVDSSTWTPPEPEGSQKQTGMRPISPRAFKRGGKVVGEAAKMRADRKPRKAKGGEAMPPVDRFINRDLKKANEYRDGPKHVGALKRGGKAEPKCMGGRSKKAIGGVPYGGAGNPEMPSSSVNKYSPARKAGGRIHKAGAGMIEDSKKAMVAANDPHVKDAKTTVSQPAPEQKKAGGRTKKEDGGWLQKGINRLRDAVGLDSPDYAPKSTGKETTQYKVSDEDRAALAKMADGRSNQEAQRKSGGRTKKQAGGPMLAGPVSPMLMRRRMDPVPTSVAGPAAMPRKKGGKVSEMAWEHSKADLNQDKKLAKKHGMSMEKWEKSALDKKHDEQQSTEGLKKGGRAKRKDGGKVFSGESYPGKIPGVVGGRTARKSGGRAKGSNISITVAPQVASPHPMAGPAGGPMVPPAGLNPAALAGMGRPNPAMPPAGGAGVDPNLIAALAAGRGGAGPAPMAPPQPPPMARKAGGRAYRTYKDMDAGAGSGLGRMEKTEIQENKRPARASGGKAYPITGGAGGGRARMEKKDAYGLEMPRWGK